DAARGVPGAHPLGRVLQPGRRPAVREARPQDRRMSDVTTAIESGLEAGSPRRGGLLREVLRERPSAIVGGAVVLLVIVIAFLAPHLEPFSVHQQTCAVYERPSAKHWLGCDDGGIDVLSLLIRGSRVSLIVGFAATLVAVFIGGTVGVVAGYFGGIVDGAL